LVTGPRDKFKNGTICEPFGKKTKHVGKGAQTWGLKKDLRKSHATIGGGKRRKKRAEGSRGMSTECRSATKKKVGIYAY